MKNCEIIEREIAELEARQIDYSVAQKLAWLYIVRDHIKQPKNYQAAMEEHNESSDLRDIVISSSDGSEFMRVIEGKDLDCVLAVIDETMGTLQTTLPRIYNGMMAKLREI